MITTSSGSLGRILGALVFGVILLAGTGVFAIQYHHDRADAALTRVIDDAGLLDAARAAQVEFKLQVQEWKNLKITSDRGDVMESLRRGVSTAAASNAEVSAVSLLTSQFERAVWLVRQVGLTLA